MARQANPMQLSYCRRPPGHPFNSNHSRLSIHVDITSSKQSFMLPRQCLRIPSDSCLRRAAVAASSGACRHDSTASSPVRKTIFSGIQPTGVPHLGNYLGAIKQWVKLQNEAEPDTALIYSLVDLHAITVRQDPKQLRQWKTESLAILLASGLDPKRSTIFHQGDVAAHSELMWILSCQASFGYLGRMTQWKDKATNGRENNENSRLGLFSYPVLMTADVLLHRTTHVPVGHDQAQHLEFTRDLATSFNHVFGNGEDVFTVPETIISPARRIMSLTNPAKKMSKSQSNPRSRILLTDTEEIIRKKVNSAITDNHNFATYDPPHRPGISNLLDILFHCGEYSQFSNQRELAEDMKGLQMKAVKERVASGIEKGVGPLRERYAQILQDVSTLENVAHDGAAKAATSAAPTMKRVRTAVGLD